MRLQVGVAQDASHRSVAGRDVLATHMRTKQGEKGADRRLSQQGKGVAVRAGEPEPVRVHDFIDPKLGKAIPAAKSTTWRATKVGSTSASTTTPPNSPSSPFVAGGIAWAVTRTPRPPNSSSRPTAAAVMATAPDSGNLKLQKFADRLGTAADHRALPTWHQQSETRSSTACFLISPRTGAAASRESRDRRQPDREHNHLQGVAHQGRTRLPTLRRQDQGIRRRLRYRQHQAQHLPW